MVGEGEENAVSSDDRRDSEDRDIIESVLGIDRRTTHTHTKISDNGEN